MFLFIWTERKKNYLWIGSIILKVREYLYTSFLLSKTNEQSLKFKTIWLVEHKSSIHHFFFRVVVFFAFSFSLQETFNVHVTKSFCGKRISRRFKRKYYMMFIYFLKQKLYFIYMLQYSLLNKHFLPYVL